MNIEVKGTQYPVRFNMNVLLQLEEETGIDLLVISMDSEAKTDGQYILKKFGTKGIIKLAYLATKEGAKANKQNFEVSQEDFASEFDFQHITPLFQEFAKFMGDSSKKKQVTSTSSKAKAKVAL